MLPHGFDLVASAREEMIHEGFNPDFPPEVQQQIAALRSRRIETAGNFHDLRDLPWSSIDNDNSRDLDQIEVAERVTGGIRVRIGIADVTAEVDQESPIDLHAESQTTTVYTAVRVFSMLPEELSTGMTSLVENEDRLAIVLEMVVAEDGTVGSSEVYRSLVRNKAQLTYNAVGPWLEGHAPAPPKLASSPELLAQVELQDRAARALREQRHRSGALTFDRLEPEAVISNGQIRNIISRAKNRASDLIEDFMVGANEVMATKLRSSGVSTIRRVVREPERWPRIVELAARYGVRLPAEPDSGALNEFLRKRKEADPLHYADVSLSVMKLMGPGEYMMARPGGENQGHFGLAAHDYTHSTAPNRRFADVVIQRLIKTLLNGGKQPYTDEQLTAIARNCTLKEDAARKVERTMNKRVAAIAMQDRVGQTFDALVTGVTPKGTFVRILNPQVEGRLMQGEHGVDVGDRLRVKLLATDARRGFIDFGA